MSDDGTVSQVQRLEAVDAVDGQGAPVDDQVAPIKPKIERSNLSVLCDNDRPTLIGIEHQRNRRGQPIC